MHDERAIIQMHQEFAAAWSRGDATAAVRGFAEDAVRVGAAGDHQRGRAEIEAALARLVSGRFKGAEIAVEDGAVRMLGPDTALWQATMEIRPGGAAPPIKGYVVDVMTRRDGRWLILETHPKLFPPPPGR